MTEIISSIEHDLLCRVRDHDPSLSCLSGREQIIMHALLKSNIVYPDSNGDYCLRDRAYVLISRYEEFLDKERRDNACKEARKQAEEEAADKRWRKDACRSWLQFWLGILFSAIGFVSGVFVEHYFTILEVVFAIIG